MSTTDPQSRRGSNPPPPGNKPPSPAGPPPLPPAGFYRRFIHNPDTIAECGGPCAAGGPETCDCGQLWEDRPWDGAHAAAIAQQVAVKAWERVLASLDDRIAELQRQRKALSPAQMTWGAVVVSWNGRIAELQRQRDAHLTQRDDWILQAIGESDPPQPPA